jgi:hypothetical protein
MAGRTDVNTGGVRISQFKGFLNLLMAASSGWKRVAMPPWKRLKSHSLKRDSQETGTSPISLT